MAKYGTSYQQYDSKTMAKVVGAYLPISAKASREIAKTIKGKSIESAINYLQAVADKKLAVPFKRFKRDVPHRRGKGFGAGRYPKKASEHIIRLLKSLKANAADKELDSDNLVIVHATAQKGPVLWHYGRIRGRRRKNTHFEAIAKEIEKKEKSLLRKATPKEDIKKEEKPKTEKKPEVKEKPVEKKEEPKPLLEKATPKEDIKKEEVKPEIKEEKPKVEVKEKKIEEKPKAKPKKKPAKKKGAKKK